MKLVLPNDGQELVVHGVGRHVIDRASGSPVPGVGVAFFGFGGPQLRRWEAYIQHVSQQASLAQASSRLLQHATPPAFVPQPAEPYPSLPLRTPPPAVPDRAAAVAAAPKARLPLPPPARMQAALTTQAVRAPARCELMETVLDEGDLEYV